MLLMLPLPVLIKVRQKTNACYRELIIITADHVVKPKIPRDARSITVITVKIVLGFAVYWKKKVLLINRLGEGVGENMSLFLLKRDEEWEVGFGGSTTEG